MTCEAIGALLWRFLGIVIILTMVPFTFFSIVTAPSALVPAALTASFGIAVAALLIVASKPLGRVTAAGLR